MVEGALQKRRVIPRRRREAAVWSPLLGPLAALLVGCMTAAAAAGSAIAAPPDEPEFNPDRPGIADGSTVVGRGRFQIETGFQHERHRDGTQTERTLFFPTLLRYGLNDHVEVRVESNTFAQTRTSDPEMGTSRESGYMPLSLGFKYQFQEQKEGSRLPSLGTIARVFPVSGTGAFRSQHTTGDLRLAADWEFAPHLSLNPNVGVAFDEDDTGATFTAGLAALTLNYEATSRLTVFVDLGFEGPEEKGGRSALIGDLGLAYLVGKNTQLDINPGTGLAGRTTPHPFYTAGISHRF